MQEKRKHQRVKTVNLLSYVSLDKNGKPLEQGMGRTLDISQGGLLLETKVPIDARYIILMALDIKDQVIDIRGKVAYSREAKPKVYHSGIRFKEKNEKIRDIIVEMVKVFNLQKNK